MSKSVIEGMFSLYQKEITTEMLMDMIKNVHTLSIVSQLSAFILIFFYI